MAPEPPSEEQVFLSTTPPGAGQRRAALMVVLTATALFLVGLPFARIQLPIFWPFIPIYESWLVIIDSITAVLLSPSMRFCARAHCWCWAADICSPPPSWWHMP
jgi:hypothetical protein